jgi:hypothetical protein
MGKKFYYCSACTDLPPQGFNKPPTSGTMCCHCKHFERTWTVEDDELEHQLWLQKRSFVTSVLNGSWTAPATNAFPAPATTEANLYGGKHFDLKKEKNAGKYNIDRYQVKSLEQHAIDYGLDTPGAYIFMFNTNVGSDGSIFNDFTPNTKAIRVDSVGTPGQHSHPIPEDRCGAVNHKSLVCAEIIKARNNSDLYRYLKIATYLKTIGATKEEFSLNRDEKRIVSPTADQRACFFW